MKKILIMVLFSFFIFTSFAQVEDRKIIDNSVDKLLIYESSKKDPLIPFILNLVLGFGIGSFAQGDIIGGLSLLGFDAIGVGLLAYGVYSAGGISEVKAKKEDLPWVSVSLIAVGGVTLAITRLVEIVLPFVHASNYNKRLRQNLGNALGGFQPDFGVTMNENNMLGFGIYFAKNF
ncbi:P13 family porin [Borrelia sp. A-FGy1]|uniref:P13 family porin n=1 Tax=Borrelia sp. A-FGy1 TaxID=2608247 RepID=UPI0015F58C3C|nr:P13 family porin [Borrelia sp. A-FGy1]QMU98853.1 P13 family porin [Borrelia sp. A-FGy1]